MQTMNEEQIRRAAGEEENSKVYKVDLNNRSICQITGLKPFTKLRCLYLNFNRIRCIENLECVPDLRELHLEYNEIRTLEGLDSNKLLNTLSLNSNRIQKIQNIGHLIRLETLSLDDNCIEKITGLDNLKELKYLSVCANALTQIDSLPAFSKLETLNADNNKIEKVSPSLFAKCGKLIRLSLANNQLKDISFVNNLASLEWFNAENNEIEAINIGSLKRLEYLNVSNNRIESLPKVYEVFPELSSFLFASNQIMSEYEILQSIAEAQMLVQIDYRGNPMENPSFQQTLFRLYKLDLINGKAFSKPGSRYISQAEEIMKELKEGEPDEDEDSRRIKMSGFYNEQIEMQMTGTKPNRPLSGRKKNVMNINYDDMERNFKAVVENEKKINSLREQCRLIFEKNGINIPEPVPLPLADQQDPKEAALFPTEPKGNEKPSPGNTTISDLQAMNDTKTKWKELKNKDKNFQIRGAVRRMSGSSRKSQVRQSSSSKLPGINSEKPELMRTQLNPPRWSNDPNLMRGTQYRPLSAKKNPPLK